jgi:hypothetical protein
MAASQNQETVFPGRAAAWAVGPAFLLLAAWFLWGAPAADIPVQPARLVSKDDIAPGARRTRHAQGASVVVGGFSHACNECHRIIDSPPEQHRPMVQHTHIALRHGMNANCFNCHDTKDRDKLVLTRGETIPFDQAPRLCSQCHGTVFRDWQRGTHGKTMDAWDASSGNQHRLDCLDCHDPHSPAYPSYKPLPAPVTLRMGDQLPYGSEHHDAHAPLREGASRGHQKPAPPTEKHP